MSDPLGQFASDGRLASDGHSAADECHLASDECHLAMRSVHAFLHGELPEATADEIRQHLMACESCVDNFDVELFISGVLRRCYGPSQAPSNLRLRVASLHVVWNEDVL